MITADRLEVRPMAAGDEPAVAAVMEGAADTALERWLWRHPSRSGTRRVVVAELDGRIVAAASAVDVELRLAGATVAAVRLRSAVAPESSAEAARLSADGLLQELRSGGGPQLALWRSGVADPRSLLSHVAGRALTARPVRLRRTAPPKRRSLRSLAIRAELAADWEPRLDELAAALTAQHPDALVRDADQALRRWSGHPDHRWHRFLLLPRFSARPVGWLVLGVADGVCRWEDLLWDHGHPAVLEAASRLAARLAEQAGVDAEEIWIAGDDPTTVGLEGLGFTAEPLGWSLEGLALRAPSELGEWLYATSADLDDP